MPRADITYTGQVLAKTALVQGDRVLGGWAVFSQDDIATASLSADDGDDTEQVIIFGAVAIDRRGVRKVKLSSGWFDLDDFMKPYKPARRSRSC